MKQVSVLQQISDRVLRFRELCLLYAKRVESEGIRARPWSSPELPFFSALPVEHQDRALASITADLEIFESMQNEGISLRDSPKLLWRMLRRLELTPSSDVFSKIGEQDAVEIYLIDSSGQRQIFRNLVWMGHASYSIEQMASLDWRFVVERDQKYVAQITDAAVGIMTGKHQQTFDPGIEAHVVHEIDSPCLYSVRVHIKFLAPVRNEGQVVGAITILGLEHLGAGRSETEAFDLVTAEKEE